MNWMRWYKVILLLVVLAIFALVPILITNLYHIGVITMILVTVLLAASLWLVITTGQISIGHGAFAAIGGFMSAAMVTVYGINSWLSLLMAVITAGVVG